MARYVRNGKAKASRFFGLALALALLLVTLVGSVVISKPLGASAQGILFPAATDDGVLDWPQVQRGPQRTGYTPEVLGTDFQVAWTHPYPTPKSVSSGAGHRV